MKVSTFGAFVITGACLLVTGAVVAQAESGATSGMTSQGLASQPAGIGERGTGQTQSTLERSGGTAQQGTTSQPSGSPLPSGVGEKGTGQTQSTTERSGAAQSGQTPQSAMERPERQQ